MINAESKIDNNRIYSGLDIGKIFFACLIPLLHIPITHEPYCLFIIKQYISRLGVPYFFCVTGFFLGPKLKQNGSKAGIKQLYRLGVMLLLWLVVYSPFLFSVFKGREISTIIKTFLFKTPAYLWYLTACIVGIALLILYSSCRKRRKWVIIIPLLLYLLGTLYSESYTWLSGGLPQYNATFLTTRNGLFFAFPLIAAGSELAELNDVSNSNSKSFVICFIFFGYIVCGNKLCSKACAI